MKAFKLPSSVAHKRIKRTLLVERNVGSGDSLSFAEHGVQRLCRQLDANERKQEWSEEASSELGVSLRNWIDTLLGEMRASNTRCPAMPSLDDDDEHDDVGVDCDDDDDDNDDDHDDVKQFDSEATLASIDALFDELERAPAVVDGEQATRDCVAQVLELNWRATCAESDDEEPSLSAAMSLLANGGGATASSSTTSVCANDFCVPIASLYDDSERGDDGDMLDNGDGRGGWRRHHFGGAGSGIDARASMAVAHTVDGGQSSAIDERHRHLNRWRPSRRRADHFAPVAELETASPITWTAIWEDESKELQRAGDPKAIWLRRADDEARRNDAVAGLRERRQRFASLERRDAKRFGQQLKEMRALAASVQHRIEASDAHLIAFDAEHGRQLGELAERADVELLGAYRHYAVLSRLMLKAGLRRAHVRAAILTELIDDVHEALAILKMSSQGDTGDGGGVSPLSLSAGGGDTVCSVMIPIVDDVTAFVECADAVAGISVRMRALAASRRRSTRRLAHRLSLSALRESPIERSLCVRRVLHAINVDEQTGYVCEASPSDAQLFDQQLFDRRHLPGKKLAHFVRVLGESAAADGGVRPSDVVGFVDTFVDELASGSWASAVCDVNVDSAKLDWLVRRAVFARIVRLCFAGSQGAQQSAAAASNEAFEAAQRTLRAKCAVDIDAGLAPYFPALDAPLRQVAEQLEDIVFYAMPGDAIACAQRAMQRVTELGQRFASAPLAADDIFPLFLFVVVHAHLPAVHEHLHYFDAFSSATRHMGPLGYSLTTLEAAVSHITST
jgi:Vacuolar sorting protein 9 (VPS9) domain